MLSDPLGRRRRSGGSISAWEGRARCSAAHLDAKPVHPPLQHDAVRWTDPALAAGWCCRSAENDLSSSAASQRHAAQRSRLPGSPADLTMSQVARSAPQDPATIRRNPANERADHIASGYAAPGDVPLPSSAQSLLPKSVHADAGHAHHRSTVANRRDAEAH